MELQKTPQGRKTLPVSGGRIPVDKKSFGQMDKSSLKNSPTLLNLLMTCFILNILFFPALLYFFTTTDLTFEYLQTPEFKTKQYILTFFAAGAAVLWAYCIYFFYKFDKYSKGGLGLIFLPGLISPYYFFNVIWRQKRPLQDK